MTIGRAVHVGLNALDPSHYGPVLDLVGCENDAKAMAQVYSMGGFDCLCLLGLEATFENLVAQVGKVSTELRGGDKFVLTFSGYGGRVPDAHGDEEDGENETWCLHDRQLLDDELVALLSSLPEDVQILLIQDTCWSATVTRAVQSAPPSAGTSQGMVGYPKFLTSRECYRVFRSNRGLYQQIQPEVLHSDFERQFMVLLSACDEFQYALDLSDDCFGLFTKVLLDVWDGGRFEGGFHDLHHALADRLPPIQQPTMIFRGSEGAKLGNPFFC